MQIEFTVHGLPAPQGSKKFVGLSKTGHGILTESSKAVRPWREAVKFAFLERYSTVEHARPLIAGAVALEVTFYFQKPKSTKRISPCVKPDLSKLVRSTEDALTDIGAWEDDSRVVELSTSKEYCGMDGMDSPGAVITIRSVA